MKFGETFISIICLKSIDMTTANVTMLKKLSNNMTQLTTYQYPKHINNPEHLVIFLHGYGANGQDLLSLSPELEAALPNSVFVSPDAIYPFEGGFFGGYQWYSLIDRSEQAMLKGAKNASPHIDKFIDEQLAKFKLPASKLILVGFSQGGMMSTYVGLRRKEKIAAVISFSGYMLANDNLEKEIKTKPPVLFTHGEEDNVVPPQAMELAASRLEALEVDVESHLIPHLGHGIDHKAIAHTINFLKRAIKQS